MRNNKFQRRVISADGRRKVVLGGFEDAVMFPIKGGKQSS